MSLYSRPAARIDRRNFLQGVGCSLAAGVFLSAPVAAAAQQVTPEQIDRAGAGRPLTEKEKMFRMASNCWPIRWIFKTNTEMGDKDTVAKMKTKYGEITLLDFPEFTKEHFPGVYQMDLMSALFGDQDDPSQYVKGGIDTFWGKPFPIVEFDPSSIPARSGWIRWPTSWWPPAPCVITSLTTPRGTSAISITLSARPALRSRRSGWTARRCWAQNRCV